jgi:hypothetical protein
MKDVSDCYHGITDGIADMIMSGDIIACKNRETKDTTLYPRLSAFLTKLSGTVTANPGEQYVETAYDLTNEIRRGDAILVNESWFRISSAIAASKTKTNTPARARAPLSVSSIKDLTDRNIYIDDFDSHKIPLDGDYDGVDEYAGR